MPSAPSWSASSSMRVIASSRAVYIASESTSISSLCFQRGLLEADVEDRGADDQPERVEARLLDEQELGDGQVGGEQARACSAPGAPRPASGTPSREVGS